MVVRARTGWRSAAGAMALLLALVSGAAGQDPRAGEFLLETTDEGLERVAACRAILVVEHVESEESSWGPVRGPTFRVRIREVLRFEADPASLRDSTTASEHAQLKAKPAEGRVLEWRFYDAPPAVRAAIERGAPFVLANDTVQGFFARGAVREDHPVDVHAWGMLHAAARPVVLPLEDGVLARLRARLARRGGGVERRGASAEEGR